jgi:uncharacterized protein with von Willebrand factor type A (vWA) domain
MLTMSREDVAAYEYGKPDICAVISSLGDEVQAIAAMVRSGRPPLEILRALQRLNHCLAYLQQLLVRSRLRQLARRPGGDNLGGAIAEIQGLLEKRYCAASPVAVSREDAHDG